ncbi:MAG TPA: hypothetical protein QF753_05535 [Victivallales bacterium]|nr:hypothetical protein [Victivallales bacterium]
MNINKSPFLFIFLLLILAGCQSLPPGTPPKGPIVEIKQVTDAPIDSKQATNIMITAIATTSPLAMKSKPPNVELVEDKFPPKLKDELNFFTLSVLKGLLAMNMINFNPTIRFDYRLYSIFSRSPVRNKSEFDIINWKLFLIALPENQLIWEHSTKMKIPIKNEEIN